MQVVFSFFFRHICRCMFLVFSLGRNRIRGTCADEFSNCFYKSIYDRCTCLNQIIICVSISFWYKKMYNNRFVFAIMIARFKRIINIWIFVYYQCQKLNILTDVFNVLQSRFCVLSFFGLFNQLRCILCFLCPRCFLLEKAGAGELLDPILYGGKRRCF